MRLQVLAEEQKQYHHPIIVLNYFYAPQIQAMLHLSDLLHFYIPSCSLLSSADNHNIPIPKWKKKKKSSKHSMLSPIYAMSFGINFPTLYAMLEQNPNSKLI